MFLELLSLGGEKTFKPHSQNRILVLLRGSKFFFLVLNWKFPLTLTKFESPLGEIACYTFKVIKKLVLVSKGVHPWVIEQEKCDRR